MGTGIAMAILNAGIPVILVEQNQKVTCQVIQKTVEWHAYFGGWYGVRWGTTYTRE